MITIVIQIEFLKETRNLMSCSSDATISSFHDSARISQQLEMKVDMVYSLLSMIDMQDKADIGDTLLSLSLNPDTCSAMRQSGIVFLKKTMSTFKKFLFVTFSF